MCDPNNPNLRRYFACGFRHNEQRDAPQFGFVCLESDRQTVFVDPETGNARFGRTVRL